MLVLLLFHWLVLNSCASRETKGLDATGPRSQRSAWHERFGNFKHFARFDRAARRDGARSVSSGPRPRPRSQRSAWHEGRGISSTLRSFPHAARRDGAQSVSSGPRPVPVAALRLARGGVEFPAHLARFHTLRAGRRAVREFRTATGPRSQRSAWHERVGNFNTSLVSTRCAPGRRAVRSPATPACGSRSITLFAILHGDCFQLH